MNLVLTIFADVIDVRPLGGKIIRSLPLPLINETGFEPLTFTSAKGVRMCIHAGMDAIIRQREYHFFD